jgi:hypothetical protein
MESITHARHARRSLNIIRQLHRDLIKAGSRKRNPVVYGKPLLEEPSLVSPSESASMFACSMRFSNLALYAHPRRLH